MAIYWPIARWRSACLLAYSSWRSTRRQPIAAFVAHLGLPLGAYAIDAQPQELIGASSGADPQQSQRLDRAEWPPWCRPEIRRRQACRLDSQPLPDGQGDIPRLRTG